MLRYWNGINCSKTCLSFDFTRSIKRNKLISKKYMNNNIKIINLKHDVHTPYILSRQMPESQYGSARMRPS